jgi:hypothetical protein
MSYKDEPLFLSEAPLGQGVLVASTDAGTPTLIHLTTSDVTLIDILELTVSCFHTEDVQLTLLWGGIDPVNSIVVLVEHQKGERQLTLPKPIRGGLSVLAYASVADVVRIWQGGATCRLTLIED